MGTVHPFLLWRLSPQNAFGVSTVEAESITAANVVKNSKLLLQHCQSTQFKPKCELLACWPAPCSLVRDQTELC